MSDRAQQWQGAFKKAGESLKQVKGDLHNWELLGNAGTQTAGQRGDRAKRGANLRLKLGELKNTFEKLQRELDALPQQEATQKSVTQWRDELASIFAEVLDLQKRAKGSAGSVASTPASTPSGSFANGSFAKMSETPTRGNGAEMQPYSNRALLEDQKQQMRDLEDQLDPLEGTVNNLDRVSRMIHREITDQNRMLDETNEAAARVQPRLARVARLTEIVSVRDRNRLAGCLSVLLLIAIIVVLIQVFVKGN